MATILNHVNNTVVNTASGTSTGYTISGISPPSAGTVTLTSSGSSGQFLTSSLNGTSYNTTWANPTTLGNEVLVAKSNPNALEVNGKVMINGIDLEERLNTIEKVLQIPERDVKLEAKYPKLKKLYDEYIQALGKYRTFESIKGDD